MAKRKANVGTSFGFGRHLLLAITTLLVLSPHSEASLVISIYNNNAVYLASDSLLTPGLDESKKIKGPKIFMVSFRKFYGFEPCGLRSCLRSSRLRKAGGKDPSQ